ncbi:hypothetical protein [Verrucomicrobium sp. BvORR106]|uniref:hypothetical protein n=1 Tax=Verrucomicrobium sp. BvORR106 TaxID=1403819 RepID=UPI000570EC19|nr:hypothetical protein [Verrucomicrobium sp. BvORR106]
MLKHYFLVILLAALTAPFASSLKADSAQTVSSSLAGCYVRESDDSQTQSTIVLSIHAPSHDVLRVTAVQVRQADLLASPEVSVITSLKYDQSTQTLVKESGQVWAELATKQGKATLKVASEVHTRE